MGRHAVGYAGERPRLGSEPAERLRGGARADSARRVSEHTSRPECHPAAWCHVQPGWEAMRPSGRVPVNLVLVSDFGVIPLEDVEKSW